MLLMTKTVVEFFRSFAVLFAVIVLPVIFLMAGITIFLHYRKRKEKQRKMNMPEDDQALLFADQSTHNKKDGDYVFFDHSFTLREYKHRLASSRARCFVLEKDLRRLRAEFDLAAPGGKVLFTESKTNKMEYLNVQTQPFQRVEEEKKELLAKIDQLTRSCNVLELENASLLEQLNLQSTTDDEKLTKAIQLQQENADLKKKIREQEWLGELIKEKKTEISFLQDQMEQRIRDHHDLSRQRDELNVRLASLEEAHLMLQTKMKESEESFASVQQELKSSKDQVAIQENLFRELKQQNEVLYATAADRQDEVTVLKEKLLASEERFGSLEQRFVANKQLLRRLYNELSNHIDAEAEQVPVRQFTHAMDENTDESVFIEPLYPT